MGEILLILLTLLAVFGIVVVAILQTRFSRGLIRLESQLVSIEKSQDKAEQMIRNETVQSRREAVSNARDLREEIVNNMTNIANLQKDQLDIFSKQLTTLTKSNEERMEKVRVTVEERLKSLQDDNAVKLDKMRETVDEKLHRTLEERLGQSFKIVSERLELVHKGLGEMQHLATGVGDLKKVLTNVKTRGILGEILLGNLLEQILSAEQYEKDVITKKGSRDYVEFAVKLPGKDDSSGAVYLPIDSKFPTENYQELVSAYDDGDTERVGEATKNLDTHIKKCAKDIKDKYIDPPHTTDFGIMYLPIEGLYAEVVRRTNLIETLQREYKIIITGPTTLAAFLNSLQMGFKTLAIEKRSSEVWRILGAVKTEFDRFGLVLKKAREKIDQAGEDIDNLVGVRTRQIQRKLKNVQEMPSGETKYYLSDETRGSEGKGASG